MLISTLELVMRYNVINANGPISSIDKKCVLNLVSCSKETHWLQGIDTVSCLACILFNNSFADSIAFQVKSIS